MKKIGILAVMAMLLLAVGVSAYNPAFEVHKFTKVTGDWVITASGWEDRTGKWNEPVTAVYNFDAKSRLATEAGYFEVETMGIPWEYSLSSEISANSAGWTQSVFTATTINDPVEFPIVLDTKLNKDAYTHYNFDSSSFSEFSESHLSVRGIGYVNVGVKTNFDDAFTQFNHVGVNEW